MHPAFIPLFRPDRYTTGTAEHDLGLARAAGMRLVEVKLRLLDDHLAGSEWHSGGRPDGMTDDASASTFLDLIGGPDTAHALANAFYDRVLVDSALLPLFRDPSEPHADRMAWWLIELFGGPRVHTEKRGGFATMVAPL